MKNIDTYLRTVENAHSAFLNVEITEQEFDAIVLEASRKYQKKEHKRRENNMRNQRCWSNYTSLKQYKYQEPSTFKRVYTACFKAVGILVVGAAVWMLTVIFLSLGV